MNRKSEVGSRRAPAALAQTRWSEGPELGADNGGAGGGRRSGIAAPGGGRTAEGTVHCTGTGTRTRGKRNEDEVRVPGTRGALCMSAAR